MASGGEDGARHPTWHYGLSIRPRRIASIASAAIAFAAVSLVLPATAFAAVAHFRYEHGEPLNDLRVTPGVVFHVTVATICRSGYATSVRDVPESEKNQVYAEYGITHHTTDQYEIDHLISLELGGSNAIGNLWPELNDHPKGYLNSKDILENRLHDLVCEGKVGLATAQKAIATDWVSAYHQYLGTWPKASATQPTTVATTAPIATTTTRPTVTTTAGVAVTITSLIGSIAPGGHESLTVHSSKPGDSCTLAVTLPSGRLSTEAGLGSTTANASGVATWTWLIGSTTGAGTARVSVSCGAGTVAGTFTIT
jgi:hypothetical protein